MLPVQTNRTCRTASSCRFRHALRPIIRLERTPRYPPRMMEAILSRVGNVRVFALPGARARYGSVH